MAANDYFQDPHGKQNFSRPSHPVYQSYTYSPYDSQSPYITPTPSHDHLNTPSASQQHLSSNKPRPSDPFVDPIPLKQTSKIQTNVAQSTQYPPPSPEHQTPTELLPDQERRRRRHHKKKKEGFFSGRTPWVVYIMTLIQLTVFIYEIIRNSIVTGSPIMIKPQFNPMIGPSTYVLINMGARFVPCMRTTPGVQDAVTPVLWPCPNTTTLDSSSPSNQCTLADLCGFSGFDFQQPDQWYRFIIPIFLHAGVIHIGFNMLLQMTMGREMEKTIGSVRFALIYFSSGIFGFVLGGNFAATAIASTGASGCLFGVLALVLLDLLYTWNERRNPVKELIWILIDIAISLVLGLLPGLDNFSHIGGFLMGLGAGVCFLHSPNYLRARIDNASPYRNVGSDVTITGAAKDSPKRHKKSKSVKAQPADFSSFVKQPVGFFKNRKPLWWAWWLIRAGALIGVIIAFIVLLTNFYNYRVNCKWCKYLSCIPINNWCELGNLQLTNTTQNNKRELLRSGGVFVMDLWEKAGRI